MSFDLFNGGLMPTLSAKSSFLDSYIVVGIWSHLKRINICSLSYNWNGFIFPLLYFLVFIFVYISQHPLHPSNICLCKETPWDTSITFSLTVRPQGRKIYIYIFLGNIHYIAFESTHLVWMFCQRINDTAVYWSDYHIIVLMVLQNCRELIFWLVWRQ